MNCSLCGGTGFIEDARYPSGKKDCRKCSGTGSTARECSNCGGKGYLVLSYVSFKAKDCHICDGTGYA